MMMKRKLKGTDLDVSRACFGTMTFGSQVDEKLACRMVDYCLERGINFFDTANVYQSGLSEELLGKALQGKRDQEILASKVRGKMGEGPDQSGLSKAAILRAVEESLARLRTDYLDVYYLHQPDYEVSLDETLEAMEALVKAGKVRYPASSNYSSWQVTKMIGHSKENNYRPALIAQQMYNLLARGVEQEFVPMAEELGVSLIAYNPLAGGLLTGKHSPSSITPGTRFDVIGRFLNMGVEPYNFVSSLNCVLAQRLLRLLCSVCKRPHRPSKEDFIQSKLSFEEYGKRIFYQSIGCDACNDTGYRGRTAIHELLGLTDNVREMIIERRPASEIRRAAEAEGLSSLRASALQKLFAGLTTLNEINRVTFAEKSK